MKVNRQIDSGWVGEDGTTYEYIVTIGISTGGPKLLNQLVTLIDEKLPATYVIAQHMPDGFTKPLAERLNAMSELVVKEAEEGDKLKRGVIYIAPGGKQLRIVNNINPQIAIMEDALFKGAKPSVNIMMESLASLKLNNKKIIAIIMTGMGNDGLEGVKSLKLKQDCKVIAQDQATSTVYGMPKAIINAELADYIVPADKIAQTIKKIVGD
ncbi:chemotaxis protein [Sporanaerobium hydrogeniformans]|uniref:Chemotaxis protein n=1 Tax=Sporanaerobium hydrogeniformans TaxID=3072179 RepID=A0AC61DHJ0_9FIRM|nr:CheB methylesterase domain-containing protein [Sporanaerobium hydrogeniformans]PHV71762.1 chemotaxis protein [Sporanaerobium hydrogeniformans]